MIEFFKKLLLNKNKSNVIDKKLKEIGYNIVEYETMRSVCYSKIENDDDGNYIHRVDITHKSLSYCGFTIKSYQEDINSEGYNNAVLLNGYELRLFMDKLELKEKEWYYFHK